MAAFDKDLVARPLSDENPGAVGGRFVPGGKDPRLIWQVPLQHHFARAWWTRMLEGLQRREPMYSAMQLTGFMLVDHSLGFTYSSHPHMLCVANDYSNFDGSIQQWNAKQPMLEGMLNGLVKVGLENEPFGGMTLSDRDWET